MFFLLQIFLSFSENGYASNIFHFQASKTLVEWITPTDWAHFKDIELHARYRKENIVHHIWTHYTRPDVRQLMAIYRTEMHFYGA